MERELLRSPMISYRSLLYNTTVLYENASPVPAEEDKGKAILEQQKITLHY